MQKIKDFFMPLIWVIIKPKKLFEKIKEKPMVALPIIFLIIIGIITGIAGYNAAAKIDYSKFGSVSPEQAEITNQLMKNPIMGFITTLTVIIKLLAELFLKALIMWGLISLLGGKGKYMHSLSITGFASIPLYIRDLVKAIWGVGSMDVNGINKMLQNITFAEFFKNSFAEQGMLFIIWSIILFTIGYSIVFNISKVKAAIVSTLYWIVSFAISLGLGWSSLKMSAKMQNMVPKQ